MLSIDYAVSGARVRLNLQALTPWATTDRPVAADGVRGATDNFSIDSTLVAVAWAAAGWLEGEKAG